MLLVWFGLFVIRSRGLLWKPTAQRDDSESVQFKVRVLACQLSIWLRLAFTRARDVITESGEPGFRPAQLGLFVRKGYFCIGDCLVSDVCFRMSHYCRQYRY